MIRLFKVFMAPEATERVSRVLQSGFIGQGEQVDFFEGDLGALLASFPVLTSSCTAAIHLVLTHLGVGPGDEVVTTPMTCVATNAPILALGARPVWADVNPETGNIEPLDVRTKITKRTKAVIAVDWTGRPAEYLALANLGVPVIRDAAHGPIISGSRSSGTQGDYICYSFGPIKHLNSVEGGAVCAPVKERDALRLRRWYGLDRADKRDFRSEQNIVLPGLKWHMNDVNAAVGRANAVYLRDNVQAHQDNARSLAGLIKNNRVRVQLISPDSNYWVFPVLLGDDRERDRFQAHMAARGVESSQVHARNDRHSAYHFPNGKLPGLDAFASRQINIPCGWWLSQNEIGEIADAVNSF